MVVNWALKPIEQPYDPLAEPSLLSMTVGMVATLDPMHCLQKSLESLGETPTIFVNVVLGATQRESP